ncbi:MAG: BlaI/MecI/CopY family transcriptional regulator [Candidatus Neomarinimicrobiota bacterium]
MPVKITTVEWEIMEAVWELKDPVSVREVLEHVFRKGEKAYTTVQTIMNNLEKKGFLRRQKIGLVNFYTPTKSRQQMVKAEMAALISRVFNGSVPALANYLIKSENLSLREIETLKALLEQRETELKGR